MKITSLAPLASILCSSIAIAAEPDPAEKQLQFFPKNLARHHVGSNLFLFNPAKQTYEPTEASASWLDDDATTGWPMMAGKQNYLVALSEPELLANFSLSARPAKGTVTLYAGDEPAAPAAKSWTVVARDIPLESVTDRKLARPFGKLAKFFLIETNVAEPGPVYGLYVYGEKPAASYDLRQRERAIDARAIFGPHVNAATTVSLTGLYAHARVDYANTPDGFKAWQDAIDDNPATAMKVLPSGNEAGVVVRLGASRSVSRVALFTEAGAKGKVDIFPLTDSAAGKPASIGSLTAAVSIVLDGSNARTSIDFPAVQASAVALRWTPDTAADGLAIRELNIFGGMTLAEYEVALKPEAVAAFGADHGPDPSKDGKGLSDVKDSKEVALGPPSPYLPGSLGFPPNIDRRRAVKDPTPLSP